MDLDFFFSIGFQNLIPFKLCGFLLHILIKKRSTPTVTVGETKTFSFFLSFPFSLPLFSCVSVHSRRLQALQRWPAAMLHNAVLGEKAGAVPGASLWQTEQMPYTNKQPNRARAASPSIVRCYISSKCWDPQSWQQRLCVLSTHYHS